MRKTFKYRLNPTKAQRTSMLQILDACRWVYNKTLETRRDAWQERKESLSRYDTNKFLPVWKQENPWLKQAHSQMFQDAQARVDLAFRAFFRRVKAGEKPGYPRFKSADRYDSFTYTQVYGNWRFIDDKHLRLSKIGIVKIKLHRPLRGTPKTLTIRRDVLGHWYACFSCIVEPSPLPATDKIAGVDVGLTHFATLSNGEQIDNPRFFRQDEKELAKANRKRDKSIKGSAERKHRGLASRHIYHRITNRRTNFAHQLSRRLINEYQFIAFEKLDIQSMQQGNFHGMNKSIADAAWNQFVQYCFCKAEEAGRTVVQVNPRGTTQTCSSCSEVVPKDLSVRVHSCPHCGLVLDRDHNAALNILARGLACIGNQSVKAP